MDIRKEWAGAEDVVQSMRRALIEQGWTFADRHYRIGHPFVWVDGEHMPTEGHLTGTYGVLQWLTCNYEKYDTPQEIMTDDYNAVWDTIRKTVIELRDHFFPYADYENKWVNHSECWAQTRSQDYAAIRTFCKGLPKTGVQHLDIGPGWGSHAFYSLPHMGATYYGLEASALTYRLQREVFGYLSRHYGKYFDAVVPETLGSSRSKIQEEIAKQGKHKIKSIPSWYFDCVPEESMDLATATWVLNEVSPSGITWLMNHTMRALKIGGFMYIRDSDRRKPGRHNVNYDQVLLDNGFEQVARMNVKNRVDLWGVPRAYKKVKKYNLSFEEAFDKFVGRFAVTAHPGEFLQLQTDPRKS